MPNLIEEAALHHIREKSRASLRNLYEAMLSSKLLVPLAAKLTRNAVGQTDVPVVCLRLPNGEGCLLAFTSEARLLEWRREGSLYAEMPARTVFKMASGMLEVDCICVNGSDREGTPKGKVVREEYESLARGILPVLTEAYWFGGNETNGVPF